MNMASPIGQEWAKMFADCNLDVVPDPMVMRVADLFIGGKPFAVQSKLDPDEVWSAIESNADGLISFFHLLMTRERIPLIDYEYTFDTTNFQALGDIAVPLHPPAYTDIKGRAMNELAKLDLRRIPQERLDELTYQRKEELRAVGYEWFPDPGPQFAGDSRILGTMLLGGLIFGAYAQMSGSDHVLQSTRNALLLELTQPAEGPLWGAWQEAELFERLNAVVSTDPRLSYRYRELPPTILPYLIEKKPRNSRELLDKALEIRARDGDFLAYRSWHRRLRSAWALGTHDESGEKAVIDVTRELLKRFPPGRDPVDAPRLWSREIGLKTTLGVETAKVDADFGDVTVSFPDWIRNWLIEGLQFRSHRKVLLRMALAKRHSDNLLLGLRRLWEAN